MHPPLSATLARSWPSALALSLLLHGSLVLVLSLLSSRSTLGKNGDFLRIDTRAPAPVTEISLVLCAPCRADHPAAQPAEAPLVVTSTPLPLVSTEDKSVPATLTGQAMPNHETIEEQGASTLRRTTGGLPGLASGTPGTGNGTTTFFQIATQGKAIVYVVDRSASMGLDGGLATAKRELLASLERLPSTARFQVIAYNRTALPLRINGQSGLVMATPDNKRCVAALLEGMEAEGSTEHFAALRRALALGPDVIFFLTDADNLRADHIRAITSLNHGRSVIHAIELGRPSGAHGDLLLYALAQDNRGCYKSVPLCR
jgi:hypothetical protein